MPHHHRRPTHRRAFVARLPNESSSAQPLEIAMNRAAALLPSERAQILAPITEAFVAFRAGHGNVEHWAQLVDAINIAKVLATRQIASDHQATFEAASQALHAVHDRHATTGSWTLRGTEIAELDLALFVHEVQLDAVSRGELASAVTTVVNRVRAALQGNAAPGTHICMPGAAVVTVGASAAA